MNMDLFSIIEFNEMRYFIVGLPNCINELLFIKRFQQENTKMVIKTCNANYNFQMFMQHDIEIVDCEYPDGTFPAKDVVDRWIGIVNTYFKMFPGSTLAVQCQYGLGRSAVLVAIALMESGMTAEDAVNYIRGCRRGAFNNEQLQGIKNYKATNKLVPQNQLTSAVMSEM